MGTGGVFLRKLRAKVEERPTGFVWIEDQTLAGSGYPASRAQIAWLAKNGIGSILTLTEKPLPAEWLDGLVISEHIPMRDHEPPDLDSMSRGADYISDQRRKGKAVLVHCLAGEGRTGCVLSAYLIRTRKIGPEEAITTLRSLKPEFVEWKQEKAVHEFAAKRGRG